ncbi:MAG: RNA polymerase sigma factor [Sedimentisphaerales bacterium]|nr:RNA polymerase sigma factor [Sedimentisphaerales bacterium]
MQKNAQTVEQDRGLAHLDGEKPGRTPERRASIPDQISLVRRLRHGDHAAAEELVDKCYERIYLFMRAMGHDRQTSEDLTQDTFLKVWNHIGQLRDGKALNGWLFRIAGNMSRLYWRRHKYEKPGSSELPERPEGVIDGSQQAAEREQFDHLHRAVARLPWKLRQAVVLHYMGQLTIAQAAQAAQVRQGTLKSRLNRALEALRKEFAEE